MSEALDIHAASAEEQAAAFRNFHDVWGKEFGVEEHVRRRIASPKYKNAQWYVGCLGRRVVTGCGCYAFQFCIDGKVEEACAFGEVHTLAEFRGRGFAPQLIAHVEDRQRDAGKSLSVLYSDIAPSYYEQLGYLLCSSSQGWTEPQAKQDLSRERVGAKLVRCDPAAERAALARLYEQFHAPYPLWINRTSANWQYLIERYAENQFYFLTTHDGARIGYVCIGVTEEQWKIRDFALVDHEEATERSLVAAILAAAGERKVKRVGGWMAATACHGEFFRLSERSREITMIKPLVSRLSIGAPHRAAGAFLHEIDHV